MREMIIKSRWKIIVVALACLVGSLAGNAYSPKRVHAQSACVEGDANGDGKVALSDFEAWRRVYLGQILYTPTPTQTPSPCPSTSTVVSPGESIQNAIDSSPAGATICIRAGEYRQGMITPKEGDTIMGEGDATILNGSRILTDFKQEGSLWYVDGQTQEGEVHGECDKIARCDRPEDFFVDDVAYDHASTKSNSFETWFFDYAADRIYTSTNPTGHKVETSVMRHAIYATGVNNVTIKNLRVEKYADPAQFGAIENGSFGAPAGNGWTVDNVTAIRNHGSGIAFFGGSDNTIQNSRALYNLQKGIGVTGTNPHVLNNELAYNNYKGAFLTAWEAGGSKFTQTDGLLVKDNYVHNNAGPGLWTDIDNINTTYEHNLVTDNTHEGIIHEISYKALINGNTVLRNGIDTPGWCYGAGILVSASPDVEIYGNVVDGNNHSVIGIQQQRGTGTHGAHETRNMLVHGNYIQGSASYNAESGVCADYPTGIDTTWNNHFSSNDYYGTHNSWAWNNQQLTSFSAWQGYGNDTAGTLWTDQTIPANLYITR